MKSFLVKLYSKILNLPNVIALKRSQKCYIKRKYKKLFGERINLDRPSTFAEKIQWLKLNDHNEKIVLYADKFAVREHVKNVIGDEYLIPLLGVWESADEVDFSKLPESFVLKPNNSSGLVFICENKADLNIEETKKKIKKWEKSNLTKKTGEWFYEKIPYKLVCEKLLPGDVDDYKMYFADGKFICTQVISERRSGKKVFHYYDENWALLDICRYGMQRPKKISEKPAKYDEMIKIATKLAEKFNFMRVDLYYIEGKIYFGELSFYPNNGFVRYETVEMDRFFSEKIKLPME